MLFFGLLMAAHVFRASAQQDTAPWNDCTYAYSDEQLGWPNPGGVRQDIEMTVSGSTVTWEQTDQVAQDYYTLQCISIWEYSLTYLSASTVQIQLLSCSYSGSCAGGCNVGSTQIVPYVLAGATLTLNPGAGSQEAVFYETGCALSTGAIVGIVFGVLACLGLCAGGAFFATQKGGGPARSQPQTSVAMQPPTQAAMQPAFSSQPQPQVQAAPVQPQYAGQPAQQPQPNFYSQPAAVQWMYLDQANQPQGPIDQAVLAGWLQAGQVPPTIQVCQVGSQQYAPAGSIPALVPPVFNLPAPQPPTFAV